MTAPVIDPDLLQAIVDLRNVFAEYRRAKGQMAELNPSADARKHEAAKQYAGDKRSIINTRANRIQVHPNALLLLLAIDADLRLKLKRRPNRHQMAKALRDEFRAAASRARDGENARIAAEKAEQDALRDQAAACAACIVFTGYSA